VNTGGHTDLYPNIRKEEDSAGGEGGSWLFIIMAWRILNSRDHGEKALETCGTLQRDLYAAVEGEEETRTMESVSSA